MIFLSWIGKAPCVFYPISSWGSTLVPCSISWPLPGLFHFPWLFCFHLQIGTGLLMLVFPQVPMHWPFLTPRFLTQVACACCLHILPTLLPATLSNGTRAPTLLIPHSPRSLMICVSMAKADLFCDHPPWSLYVLEFLPFQGPCQYNLASFIILKCMNSLRLYPYLPYPFLSAGNPYPSSCKLLARSHPQARFVWPFPTQKLALTL